MGMEMEPEPEPERREGGGGENARPTPRPGPARSRGEGRGGAVPRGPGGCCAAPASAAVDFRGLPWAPVGLRPLRSNVGGRHVSVGLRRPPLCLARHSLAVPSSAFGVVFGFFLWLHIIQCNRQRLFSNSGRLSYRAIKK